MNTNQILIPGNTSSKCRHCGMPTKGGNYLPGHDAKHVANLRADVAAKCITRDQALAELNLPPYNLYNKLVRQLNKL